MEAGLCLGSNIGDRLDHLRRARDAIAALPDTGLMACSPVYETEPVDVQPEHLDKPFLNAVLVATTALDPLDLSRSLHDIENALGRVRAENRNAPRTVDIDMLYFGDLRLENEKLTVPHPHWSVRRFVVQPLSDVRPDLVIPGAAAGVRDVLLSLPDAPEVVLFAEDW